MTGGAVAVRRLAPLLAAALVATACSGNPGATGPEPTAPEQTTAAAPSSDPAPVGPSEEAAPPAPVPPADPDDVRIGIALRAVDRLAGSIGPRVATGPAYRRAARWVAGELRGVGYDVRQQRFRVPGGDSWGVPVPAGRSTNVVATPPDFDPEAPHLLVGAHLDTVAPSPGAEDNASGVGVLLAAATALQGRSTRLPVVLVAFGAEEPRGPSDDDHHYGSRYFVAELDDARRTALRGMVSLDRVGVGATLPVCSAGTSPGRVHRQLLRAARRAGAEAHSCTGQRSSDHWSFVRAGLPGARLGSTPYAGYHGPGDVPEVVARAQLRRAARTVVAWVSGA